MSFWANLFGGGIVKSIEKVALEAIETDIEKAEASAITMKAVDPNGAMRRDLSRFVCKWYGIYLGATMLLIAAHIGFGEATQVVEGKTIVSQTKEAMDAITGLFVPITTAFSIVLGASFGVNGVNSFKGK